MKNKKPRFGLLALIAIIALLVATLVLPPLHKSKVQRVIHSQTVNHIASVSIAKQIANAQTDATTK